MTTFSLTARELKNAVAAIQHHGYSTMLPEPPEWRLVLAHWIAVSPAIETIDLASYKPYRPMTVFAPKSRSNVRVIHLLHPQDLIVYTALVMILKNDIELARVPRRDRKVFSYRVDRSSSSTLYESQRSYEAYRQELSKQAGKRSTKFVALADIADFYPRVQHSSVLNVLKAVAKTRRASSAAEALVGLLAGLMNGAEYGVPIGPYASRLLGEAILIDSDNFISSRGAKFVRWVDDYNIFCASEYEAQTTLFKLGERLFSMHGLTCQSAKTKILPARRYIADVLTRHEDLERERDRVVSALRRVHSIYDDDDGTIDLDESNEEVVEAAAVLRGADLKALIEDSLADTELIDYEAVTYALSRLPLIDETPRGLKREVLELTIDNADLLYPVAEQIAKFVLSFKDLSEREQTRISRKLLNPLKGKFPPPDYYAMWILHIFASSSDWNHASDILEIYRKTNSEVVKRQAALAIATSGTAQEASALRADYEDASPMLRQAILLASKWLPPAARRSWRNRVTINHPIDRIVFTEGTKSQ